MKAHKLGFPAIAPLVVLLAGAVLAGPAAANDSDASFDRHVAEFHRSLAERGTWHNLYMAHGTRRYAAASADEVLAATLRVYTRSVLDRGGWANAFVNAPGYDAGNALVAVRPGEGVTTVAAPERQPMEALHQVEVALAY